VCVFFSTNLPSSLFSSSSQLHHSPAMEIIPPGMFSTQSSVSSSLDLFTLSMYSHLCAFTTPFEFQAWQQKLNLLEDQLPSGILIVSFPLAVDALQAVWGAWNKSTPDPAKNLPGWSSTNIYPCSQEYTVGQQLNWRGVECLNYIACTEYDANLFRNCSSYITGL